MSGLDGDIVLQLLVAAMIISLTSWQCDGRVEDKMDCLRSMMLPYCGCESKLIGCRNVVNLSDPESHLNSINAEKELEVLVNIPSLALNADMASPASPQARKASMSGQTVLP